MNLEVSEEMFEEMQAEFAQQEQNDPNISPVSIVTIVYNATESNTTRPTSECNHRYAAVKQFKASASATTFKSYLKILSQLQQKVLKEDEDLCLATQTGFFLS